MSASRLRTIGEAASVAALVGSLVFVGVQIHQNAEATRAATVQRLGDALRTWNLTMADPRLWEPAARMMPLDDYSKASTEDRDAVDSQMRSLFAIWSNAQFQHSRGYLDEEDWQGMLRNLRMNLDGTYSNAWTRLVRRTWTQNRPVYPERFQALFDSIDAAVSSGRGSGGEAMDMRRLRKIGAHYTAAWNSGDPGQVAAFFAPNGSLRVNEAEPAVGRDAIAGVVRGFMTAFPDLHLVMDSLVEKDGAAQYHWTFIGTNTGPGGTGKAVRFSGYEAWTLDRDGLITRSLGHFDEAEYHRQLEHGVGGP
ncbi:MAG: ester cyclase [Candidatus Palauibacterales bacterium]|nr:ester cyclase [Candidatus Palauibacterales bacterium]MDP2530914.1 ester cyclase [Candidatus Palauibacterales bacterium]MDP2584974.1 ester cyclase [Candidatus Palauibacterales bacterium]